jgi:hypothetical protein
MTPRIRRDESGAALISMCSRDPERHNTGRITTDPRTADTPLALRHREAGNQVVELPSIVRHARCDTEAA